MKIIYDGRGKTSDEIVTAIRQIISNAITSDDVFGAAGLKKPNVEILDDKFLRELKNISQVPGS